MSLTIGAAVATLLVAGGILAGPAILDCSHNPDGIGACLRGKLDQSAVPVLQPDPVPQPSVEPAAVDEPPARNPGWIEANATEYEDPAPALAELHGPAGDLGAAGSAPTIAGAWADVAIAPSGQILAGGSLASRADVQAPQVALAETPGRLAVEVGTMSRGDATAVSLTPLPGIIGAGGSALPAPGAPDEVAIAAPAGSLSAGGREGPGVSADALAAASSLPLPDVGGEVGSSSVTAGATLEAELNAVPETPALVAVEPPIPLTRPPAKPKTAPPIPPPIVTQDAPRKIPKYNPRYPNVLLLPPPNTGSNSSFATLDVH